MNLTEYRCRRCNSFLFESDADWGRVRVTCHNRVNNRPCNERQVVFLGGRRAVALHKGPPAPSPEPPQMRAPAEERREALALVTA